VICVAQLAANSAPTLSRKNVRCNSEWPAVRYPAVPQQECVKVRRVAKSMPRM
jgi:hypothetical protein